MNATAGTATLARLNLRQDRRWLAAWIGGLVVLMYVRVAGVVDAHQTQSSLDAFAVTARDNAAAAALNGPPNAIATLGGRVSFEIFVTAAVAAALLSLLLVTRHDRAEEQAGRTELVRSAPVGALAQSFAALVLVLFANGLFLVGNIAVLLSFGLPADGTVALAVAVACAGLVFGAISLLVGQFTESARTANQVAGAVLAVAFLIRAAGDAAGTSLSLLSPLGWVQAGEPFATNRIVPLALTTVAAGLVAAGAGRVVLRRDVGSALIATRPGRAHAAASLGSPLGLAVRLHRGATVGWLLGMTAFAALFGAFAADIETVLADNPALADTFSSGSATPLESFLSSIAVLVALGTTGYVVQTLMRLPAEEVEGRAELLLSGPVARRSWAVSHIVVAGLGSTMMLAVAGAAMGLVHGLQVDDAAWVGRLAVAHLVLLPGVWLVAAAVVAVYGAAPRRVAAAWFVLAGVVTIAVLDQAISLPGPVRAASPFTHLPALPGGATSGWPVTVVLLAAGVLAVAGLGALDRRDLAAR